MSEWNEPLPKYSTDVMEPPLDPGDKSGLHDPEQDEEEEDDLDDPENPEDEEDTLEDEDDEPDDEDIPLVVATENRR